jgi:phosphate-selective porin
LWFFWKERPDRTGRKTDGRGVMSEKVEAAACFREGFNCSQAVLSTWGAEFGLEKETAKQKGLFTERCPRFVRDAAEILEDVL